MASVKNTLGWSDLIKLISIGMMIGGAVIGVNSKLDAIESKVDVLIATDKGIHNVQEVQRVAMQKQLDENTDQVNINTLTIKTIADYLEPKSFKPKNYK